MDEDPNENYEKAFARKQRILAAKYSRVFHTKDGATVLADLIEHFDPLGPSMQTHELAAPSVDGLSKALVMARNDGHSDVFLRIKNMRKLAPNNDNPE
jgi:hypothetical protein